MRRPLIFLFVVALAGIRITSSASSPEGDVCTEFAMNLHRAIQLVDTGENILFSPLGVSLILGMIRLGANGTTLHQIKQALKLQGNQESEEFPGLQKLSAVISEENKEFTFNLANALYLQEGFRVKEKYLHSNKNFFKSAIKLVNFQDSKASAETISGWVDMQTNEGREKSLPTEDNAAQEPWLPGSFEINGNAFCECGQGWEDLIRLLGTLAQASLEVGWCFKERLKEKYLGKIRNLFSSEDIGPLTKIVLVNAIYFKGEWKHKFVPDATRLEDFKVKRGVTTKIPMMRLRLKTKLGYFSANNLNYQVLELPYKGDALSLFLALPSQNVEIGDLDKLMTTSVIKGWFTALNTEEVEVALPRFKIEHKVDLKGSLLKMNVTDLFNQNCDLSGITDAPNIYISKVVQKVTIEINEEGSEAAASTGMQAAAMSLTNHSFVADHPFLFFIKHNQSGSILFMGKVTNPDVGDARGRDVESL